MSEDCPHHDLIIDLSFPASVQNERDSIDLGRLKLFLPAQNLYSFFSTLARPLKIVLPHQGNTNGATNSMHKHMPHGQ
jgi:hypothetical protein